MARIIEEREQETGKEKSIDNYRDLFLPLIENNPSLEEALDQLYSSINLKNYEAQRNKVINECKENRSKKFLKILKTHPKINKKAILIILTFTYIDPVPNLSPYLILNSNLESNDRENGIKKVSKYFFILIKSLRYLTPINTDEEILYTADIKKLNIKNSKKDELNYIPYKKGNIKTFWGFTSAIQELSDEFLKINGFKKIGTRFIIHGDFIGYDISVFSCLDKSEKEILLEPETKFKVISSFKFNGVIDVNCKVLKKTLVLEDILKLKEKKQIKIEEQKNIENSGNKIIIKNVCNKININKNTILMNYNFNKNIYNEKKVSNKITLDLKKFNNDETEISKIAKEMKNNNNEEKEFSKIILDSKNFNGDVKEINNIAMNGKNFDSDEEEINQIVMDLRNINIDEVEFSRLTLDVRNFNDGVKEINKEAMDDESTNYNETIYNNEISINTKKFNYDEKETNKTKTEMKNNNNKDENDKITQDLKNTSKDEMKDDNKIIMVYKINKDSKGFIVLGEKFVKNNKGSCKLIINKKEYDLCEYIEYDEYEINKNDDSLTIVLTGIKTEKVTDLSFMFYNCETLASLDFQSFKTEKISNMNFMFAKCKSLKSLDLRAFKVNMITNMSSMFHSCSSLSSIDLESFNTKNVIDMSNMFWGCCCLNTLNLSSFNTENVTKMSKMFWGCTSLIELNLSSFNTKNVINMEGMFYNCCSLIELNLSSFNTQNVINMEYMFYYCNSLEDINLSSFNTLKVTRMDYMFFNCSSLTTLDLSPFKISNTDTSFMFEGCENLKNFISSDKNIIDAFNYCK